MGRSQRPATSTILSKERCQVPSAKVSLTTSDHSRNKQEQCSIIFHERENDDVTFPFSTSRRSIPSCRLLFQCSRNLIASGAARYRRRRLCPMGNILLVGHHAGDVFHGRIAVTTKFCPFIHRSVLWNAWDGHCLHVF